MTSKIKISEASSLSKKLSDSSSNSPFKGGKYKNFLASVLTPRKKNKRNIPLPEVPKLTIDDEICRDSINSDDLSEPIYSSVQKCGRKPYQHESEFDSTSSFSPKKSEFHHKQITENKAHLSVIYSSEAEPVYATVNKERNKHLEDANPPESINESNDRAEDIKMLQQRLKEVTNENLLLHKEFENFIKEEKWKEQTLHAELKMKISQLEADTHRQVTALSEQVQTLFKERQILADQIQVLHDEKQVWKMKYEDLSFKTKSMVSPEQLKKLKDEHERLLNQTRKKHLDEINNLQQQNDAILESKTSLMVEVQDLKEKLNSLRVKNEKLENSEADLLQQKTRLLQQLEETKQMQEEAQNMLLSVLKIAEDVTSERNILLDKASYQDYQSKLIHSNIIDYSLNLGRLQEHVANLSKDKWTELQKLKMRDSNNEENVKSFYGKQLELMQSKILSQNNLINELEKEKNKLELQLESLWRLACTGKTKLLEEIKTHA